MNVHQLFGYHFIVVVITVSVLSVLSVLSSAHFKWSPVCVIFLCDDEANGQEKNNKNGSKASSRLIHDLKRVLSHYYDQYSYWSLFVPAGSSVRSIFPMRTFCVVALTSRTSYV